MYVGCNDCYWAILICSAPDCVLAVFCPGEAELIGDLVLVALRHRLYQLGLALDFSTIALRGFGPSCHHQKEVCHVDHIMQSVHLARIGARRIGDRHAKAHADKLLCGNAECGQI